VVVRSLHLYQFKNWESLDLTLGPGLFCITGNNGVGKTNILDAIYYLSLTKSYLSSNDSQNVRLDADSGKASDHFMLEAKIETESGTDHLQCIVKRGSRKIFRRNKKEYPQLFQHIGRYPVVMIAPQDSRLLLGGSEERRKFMDALLSQYNRKYLEDLILYNRILQQRNSLLKQNQTPSAELLEVLDMQLEVPGERIIRERTVFMKELAPIFAENYTRLAGKEEFASLELSCNTALGDLRKSLRNSLGNDLRLGYTTAGPHKDDISCLLRSQVIKRFGSQGQQKTFLTALKLAEFELLAKRSGKSPILLLDDIFDKLDDSRVSRLLHAVYQRGVNQVFITDTGSERLKATLNELGIEAEFIEL
jgi:DNA replication and repair protein RecF